MASADYITVNVRVTIDGRRDVARWRLRLLGLVARILQVPLRADFDKVRK